jgi:hypothetical protein
MHHWRAPVAPTRKTSLPHCSKALKCDGNRRGEQDETIGMNTQPIE